MSQPLPWDDLCIPASGLNRLLAAPGMASPASWAVDRQGRLLFVIELSGNHLERYQRDVVTVHGLDIDLRTGDQDGHQQLVMTLESEQNADLFAVLCKSLLNELVGAKSSASSLEITLHHLRRWKAFLASRNAKLLTAEEIRGLFAELWFLLELTATSLGMDEAVFAWHGPDEVQQDFIFSGQAVEIKSLVPTDPRTVRVSSENQLDTAWCKLFLVTILISECTDLGGRSLNELIDELSGKSMGSEAQFQFDSKLAQSGYLPLEQYDKPLLNVVGAVAYEVTPKFPRIVRSALPAGIIRVAYQIQLEHLEPFKCDVSAALGVA
jgi:hypothetical protein